MQSARPARPLVAGRHRPDVRRRALIITAVATSLLGFALAMPITDFAPPTVPRLSFAEVLDLRAGERARAVQIRERFEQGVAMLQMRRYEYALTAFHRVLALAPRMPEAHVNMGFALLGLEQWAAARSFFESAIELRRDQINAYYGLAVALESMGDKAGALGAMQTYLHRAPADDPFRQRAAAALWEWREGAPAAASLPPVPVPPASHR